MTIHRFEDILAWQKAQNLAVKMYTHFGESRDFDFKRQICRAAVSISNNIAEGFERKTNKDFSYFLYVSKASCAEVRSMLYLANRLEFIPKDVMEELLKEAEEISRMLSGFIKTLNRKQFNS